MNIKYLFEDFEKQYLFTSDREKHRWEDKRISRAEILNCFSIFVNYHSDRCIHILKDTQISNWCWRVIKMKYDLKTLYINYDKIYQLI